MKSICGVVLSILAALPLFATCPDRHFSSHRATGEEICYPPHRRFVWGSVVWYFGQDHTGIVDEAGNEILAPTR